MSEIIIFLVVVWFVGFMLAGATNKVVIYYDIRDLVISTMPWVSLLLGSILVSRIQGGGEVNYDNLSVMQIVFHYLSWIVFIGLLLYSGKMSSIHNKTNIVFGLIIGLFKIAASLIGLTAIIGNFLKIFDKQSSNRDRGIALLVIGGISSLGYALVNGERVYDEKGWDLPPD